jgi:3D-(3,5/4)-trihydroxycyclohexane-1,2-dione acylhydrolase (decyclizing)
MEETVVIVVRTDREAKVPGYESWWDVAVAETSSMESVQKARKDYEVQQKKEKYYF